MKWIPLFLIGLLQLGSPLIGFTADSQSSAESVASTEDDREGQVAVQDEWKSAGAFDEASNYFLNRFSPLDPVYITFGWRGEFHAKFQLSFKYRIIKEDGRAARKVGLLDDFYFSYTQFSLWDFGEESAPFRDTNYKPGMFYQNDFWKNKADWLDTVGLRAGFEHESNGQNGLDSRSLNILYLRPRLVLGDARKFYFEIAPKAYVYAGNLGDNPDIADYRGHVDLNLRAGYGNGWQVSTTLRKGTGDHYGSVQVDATYPLRRLLFLDGLGGYLHLQYFNGWGESLIDYNRKLSSQFRVGIMILR